MVPDVGGISGGSAVGSGILGSVGAANMSYWADDKCGHNATYTTVGVGVGTPQAGIGAGLSLGWANFQSPTSSSFQGDFKEANVTIGPISVTLWGGGGWSGLTLGLTSPEGPGSASYQNVNYQYGRIGSH
jgi:hypothetical protein